MMIDHNHTHQWEQIGVREGPHGIGNVVIYLCAECDAWTSLDLEDTARVPFHNGNLPASTECVCCGSDVTDPKNRGDPIDPDADEWVCNKPICRATHEPVCDGDSRLVQQENDGGQADE